jgi:hypothetical protein
MVPNKSGSMTSTSSGADANGDRNKTVKPF